MTTLREAAQQAVEALCCVRDMVAHPDNLEFIDRNVAALRAALAQQDPEFLVTNCTLWGSPPKPHEYWSEFFSAMVETRTLAGVFISDAALAQQAEPVAAWKHAAVLEACVGSDANGRSALDALYKLAAPPQRKPLTEGEIERHIGYRLPAYSMRLLLELVNGRAHGIGGDDGQA